MLPGLEAKNTKNSPCRPLPGLLNAPATRPSESQLVGCQSPGSADQSVCLQRFAQRITASQGLADLLMAQVGAIALPVDANTMARGLA